MSEAPDFLKLGGRTVLVTGASSGIGRATAIEASVQGARVVLLGRREDALEAVRRELRGEGHVVVPFDLAEQGRIAEVLADVVQTVGRLDGLVHAAGTHEITPIRATNVGQIGRLFESNVTNSIMLVRAFRSPRVRAETASIVLMSSAVGLVGEAGVSVYAATKAAVASLSRSLALELADEGIRVNSIAAGMVETPLAEGIRSRIGASAWSEVERAHPLGLGSAKDIANSALFLLSPASAWVTGSVLVVDGGYTAR